MKTPNNDDQFKFLIACIKHASNGKIDFEKVATECEIVTKGAAAKRYERMMKAHGVYQPTGPFGRDTGVQPLRAKKSGADSASPSKKRKRAPAKVKVTKDDELDYLEPSVNDDDEAEQGAEIKDEEADDGDEIVKREDDVEASDDENERFSFKLIKTE